MPSNDIAALSSHTTSPWQQLLQDAIKDPAELLTILGLSSEFLPAARLAAHSFPLRVPRGFVSRMQHGDPNDPLLKQVLPLGAELITSQGYSHDPVGDSLAKAEAGIIHKYHQRALFISTGACAVHCRYCFRRHFPYAEELAAKQNWQRSLQWLAEHPDIHEVILSGGDPLSLSDAKLKPLLLGLANNSQVHTLRIHTRQPIVLPERITSELLETLKLAGKKIVMVVHANHANEIDASVGKALGRLNAANIQLLNQAVLLRGVNDNAQTLAELSRKLFENDVLPYYLHLLDAVQGAAHFDVSSRQALVIHKELSALLPGYLVPRLVKENAGEPNKTLVS